METPVHINTRLPNRVREFFKQGLFLDVTLVSPNGRYRANRVFLAYFCGYFRRLFKTDMRPEIEIPFDDGEIMKDVILFLRSGKLTFNMRNFQLVLKAAEVYDIDSLKEIGLFCMKECVTAKTIRFATKALLDVGLVDFACANAGLFVADFKRRIERKQDLEPLLQYMNPRVLAAVLSQPDMKMDPVDRIKLIDNYIGDAELSDDLERQALQQFVDWSRRDSYRLFAQYKCGWVSPKVARPMLSRLLDVRRKNMRAMMKDCEGAAASVNRWSPMVWMTAISNAEPAEQVPTVDVVKFAQTLGGAVSRPFNPAQFGLIQLSSTKPMCPDYSVSNVVFPDESYFLSEDTMFTDEQCFVSLDLGPGTRFVISKVELDSSLQRALGSKRAAPAAVAMKLDTNGGESGQSGKHPKIMFQGGKGECVVEKQVPCHKVTFTMLGRSGAGGMIMRLKNVELTGHFLVA